MLQLRHGEKVRMNPLKHGNLGSNPGISVAKRCFSPPRNFQNNKQTNGGSKIFLSIFWRQSKPLTTPTTTTPKKLGHKRKIILFFLPSISPSSRPSLIATPTFPPQLRSKGAKRSPWSPLSSFERRMKRKKTGRNRFSGPLKKNLGWLPSKGGFTFARHGLPSEMDFIWECCTKASWMT